MTEKNKNLVVIPAHNAEDSLPRTIDRLQALPDDFELLVVNDGSTDFTSQLAHELAVISRLPLHVVDLPLNGGIGAAVQTGYLFAAEAQKYDYVIQYGADGQHDVRSIVALTEQCERYDLDLCIGSRFLQADSGGAGATFSRRLGIRFLSVLIHLLSGVRTTDPTSGFRCAGPRAWMDFVQQYPEDSPEPESLYWCLRNKLRVGEVAVLLVPSQHGVASMGACRAAYYMAKVTLAILVDLLRPKEDPLA